MTKFPPYVIMHIHLEDGDPALESLSGEDARYYLVLWWGEIPLGDLFIEKSQAKMGNLRADIFKAIEPALQSYLTNRQLNTDELKEAFLNNDREAFASKMQALFLPLQPPGTIAETLDLSIIICTRNRSSYLLRCLNSLSKLHFQPREIIVVDNAPSDESTRKVSEQFEKVSYLLEPKPGLDVARNAGARLASSSIVAYVDDDVIVHAHLCYRICEVFSNDNVAAMTGLVIAYDLITEAQQIFEKYWSFNRGYADKLYNNAAGKLKHDVVRIGAGANMAFRRSIFAKVGYFDERLDVGAAGCNGDSEMWYRILATGADIHYNPRAIVFHEHRKEITALNKQLFNYMRGFAAAGLIQQEQDQNAGFKKHLYYSLPLYYLNQLVSGFPHYRFRYRTLWSEIRGVFSGILYFYKHRRTPSHSHSK